VLQLADRNPSGEGFRFRVDASVTHLAICDLEGRPIRQLPVQGGIAWWNGPNAAGRH